MNPNPNDIKYKKPTSIKGTPAFFVTGAISTTIVAVFCTVAYFGPYLRKDGPKIGKEMDEWSEKRLERIFFKDQTVLSALQQKKSAEGETGKTLMDEINAV